MKLLKYKNYSPIFVVNFWLVGFMTDQPLLNYSMLNFVWAPIKDWTHYSVVTINWIILICHYSLPRHPLLMETEKRWQQYYSSSNSDDGCIRPTFYCYQRLGYVGWVHNISTLIGLFKIKFLHEAPTEDQAHYSVIMVAQTNLVNLYPFLDWLILWHVIPCWVM